MSTDGVTLLLQGISSGPVHSLTRGHEIDPSPTWPTPVTATVLAGGGRGSSYRACSSLSTPSARWLAGVEFIGLAKQKHTNINTNTNTAYLICSTRVYFAWLFMYDSVLCREEENKGTTKRLSTMRKNRGSFIKNTTTAALLKMGNNSAEREDLANENTQSRPVSPRFPRALRTAYFMPRTSTP